MRTRARQNLSSFLQPVNFRRKTGRVLAISRAGLACVFLLALITDPAQPARDAAAGYTLLAAYLVVSVGLLAIAWADWWLDFRIATAVHVLDLGVFVGAVYVTERGQADFASPFMAFAVFLLVGAALRWNWRGVALTAVALVLANLLAALTLAAWHVDIDMYRFGRRLAYMIALSGLIIWFSTDLRSVRTPRLPEPDGPPGERGMALLVAALGHVRQVLHARRAVITLDRDQEPVVMVVDDDGGTVRHHRLGPTHVAHDPARNDSPVLFDGRRRRAIVLVESERFEGRRLPAPPLADWAGEPEGVIVTFRCAAGSGQLLIAGIVGLCTDDLRPAEALAREIGLALDHEDMAALARANAAASLRHALARDLHDSVAQFLAGTLFRLEALRRWVADGRDPELEFVAMKDALRREQEQLRLMIERLRRGEEGDRRTDLVDEIETLLGEVGHHWRIATRLEAEARPLPVPVPLAHEVRQVVREAVANAARHGQCDSVVIALGRETGGLLRLSIGDNGKGFPSGAGVPRPRSISERVEALGGRLTVADRRPGVLLNIVLPARNAA